MSRNVRVIEDPVRRASALSNVCGGCALFILIVGSLVAVLLLDALLRSQSVADAPSTADAFGRLWGLVVLLSWLCATSALLLRRHAERLLPLTGACVCLAVIPFVALTPVGETVLRGLPPIATALLFGVLDPGAIYVVRRVAFATR